MLDSRTKEYIGLGPESGKRILNEDAFDYALLRCGAARTSEFDESQADHREFRDMVTEWFYSGNWVEIYDQ